LDIPALKGILNEALQTKPTPLLLIVANFNNPCDDLNAPRPLMKRASPRQEVNRERDLV
jgi:hypothetical protein